MDYKYQAEWNIKDVRFKKDHIAALYFILSDIVHGVLLIVVYLSIATSLEKFWSQGSTGSWYLS